LSSLPSHPLTTKMKINVAFPALTAFALLTVPFAESQECNGLNIMNSYTMPAGACLMQKENGEISSTMIDCDDGGNGIIKMWAGEGCLGPAMMSMSIDFIFGGESEMAQMIDMVCDGEDCPYATVKSYDVANLTDIAMVDGFSTTSSSGSGSSGSSSGSGSSEEWEQFIDCDANEFENWGETAIVMADCVPITEGFGGTTYYQSDSCDDGHFQMALYYNSECIGPALAEGNHFLNEGVCPEAICPDGAPRMQYLIGLAMVGLAVGAI